MIAGVKDVDEAFDVGGIRIKGKILFLGNSISTNLVDEQDTCSGAIVVFQLNSSLRDDGGS